MKKLAFALSVLLIFSMPVMAAESSDKMGLDVGVSLFESDLTLRLDTDYVDVHIPVVEGMKKFSVGAKKPDLLFDLYGSLRMNFSRGDDGGLLTDWEFAEHPATIGVGKAFEAGDLVFRGEGYVMPELGEAESTEYGALISLQYKF